MRNSIFAVLMLAMFSDDARGKEFFILIKGLYEVQVMTQLFGKIHHTYSL